MLSVVLWPRLGLYHDSCRLCAPRPHGSPVSMSGRAGRSITYDSTPPDCRQTGCYPRTTGEELHAYRANETILPSSRRSPRPARHRTCYVIRLGAVAPHMRRHEIIHPITTTGSARHHMIRGERQRMRRITTPVERFAAIIAARPGPPRTFTQNGAITMIQSRILAHVRRSPPRPYAPSDG